MLSDRHVHRKGRGPQRHSRARDWRPIRGSIGNLAVPVRDDYLDLRGTHLCRECFAWGFCSDRWRWAAKDQSGLRRAVEAGLAEFDGGPWTRLQRLRSLPVLNRALPAAIRRYPVDLIRWDLRRVPLPFESGSASVIFTQWVLEYLTVDEALRVLAECQRVLEPGGLIRLNQTDIGGIVAAYESEGVGPSPQAITRAGKFLESAAPGHTTLSARLFRRGGVQQLFDRPKLEWMLAQTGFTEIRFRRLNEGQCPDLPDLEHEWVPPLIRVEARSPANDRSPAASQEPIALVSPPWRCHARGARHFLVHVWASAGLSARPFRNTARVTCSSSSAVNGRTSAACALRLRTVCGPAGWL